jgi:hypothetical protein
MINQQPSDPFSIDCARAQDIIFDLQESAMESGSGIIVPADDQVLLQAHLAACTDCRLYRKTMVHLTASLTELAPMPVPTGLEDRVMKRLTTEDRAVSTSPSSYKQPWKKYAPIAAAVLVLVLAIPLILKSMSTSPSGQQLAQQPAQTAELQPIDLAELATLPERIQPIDPMEQATAPEQAPQAQSSFGNPGMDPSPHPLNRQPLTQQHSQQERQSLHYAPGSRNPNESLAYEKQPGNGNNYRVDPSALASAPQQNPGQLLRDTFASDDEGDVYYDPVSNLVGF